jgi:hypothetical protein
MSGAQAVAAELELSFLLFAAKITPEEIWIMRVNVMIGWGTICGAWVAGACNIHAQYSPQF